MNTSRKELSVFAAVTLILFLVTGFAAAQNAVYGVNEWPTRDIANNMQILGYNDLQHRTSYMPTVVKQQWQSTTHYILYASEHVGTGPYLNPLNGQMEYNGTSIIDVTNPSHPVYLKHLPSPYPPPNNEGRHVRVCAGSDLPGALYPGKYFMIRTDGQVAHALWDVTNPSNPVFISNIMSGLSYTHKESWDCTSGYVALPHNSLTWKSGDGSGAGTCVTGGCNFAIYDLHDPYKPKFITDYGLVGQAPGSTVTPTPNMIHEAVIYTDPTYGTRIYGAYGIGVGGDGWLQIADLSKILALGHQVTTDADILATQIGATKMSYEYGMHTYWPWLHIPLPDYSENSNASAVYAGDNVPPAYQNLNPQTQDFGLATTEGTNTGCVGYTAMGFVVDLNYPTMQQPVANMHVPHHLVRDTTPFAGGRNQTIDFCDINNGNGRFGSHGVSEDLSSEGGQAANWGKNPFFHRFNAIAWFGGGVHVWDLRDPFTPKDVAYYIPAANGFTEQNCATRGGTSHCTNEIGINNAATDDRGFVYIVDRYGTGTWVLEVTGEPREALLGGDRDRDRK
jgi:hypothetical protein